MSRYFTRQRFGRPQFLAGLLLSMFLAQTIWLVRVELRASKEPDGLEATRIREGWKQWHGHGIAGAPFGEAIDNRANGDPQALPSQDTAGFDREHSPLLFLVSAAPLLAWPEHLLNVDSASYLSLIHI